MEVTTLKIIVLIVSCLLYFSACRTRSSEDSHLSESKSINRVSFFEGTRLSIKPTGFKFDGGVSHTKTYKRRNLTCKVRAEYGDKLGSRIHSIRITNQAHFVGRKESRLTMYGESYAPWSFDCKKTRSYSEPINSEEMNKLFGSKDLEIIKLINISLNLKNLAMNEAFAYRPFYYDTKKGKYIGVGLKSGVQITTKQLDMWSKGDNAKHPSEYENTCFISMNSAKSPEKVNVIITQQTAGDNFDLGLRGNESLYGDGTDWQIGCNPNPGRWLAERELRKIIKSVLTDVIYLKIK